MKWLFVTHRVPWPMTHGTWLRVHHLMASLAHIGENVNLLTRLDCVEGIEAVMAGGVNVLAGPEGELPPQRQDARHLYEHDASLAEILDRRASEFDAVVLCGARAMQYAPSARQAGCIITDMVDDPVLEESRRLGSVPRRRLIQRLRMRGFLRNYQAYEQSHASGVSAFVFVTPADGLSFQRRNGRSHTVVVANGVDVEYFRPPVSESPEAPSVVLPANFAHPPNADAAEYLLNSIAPQVWPARPDAKFMLLGANPPSWLQGRADQRVAVTGFVDDLRPALGQATVVALPLRIGTGIKNKLLEAWAMGRAVVASPPACQGVPAHDGENVLVGGSADELAEAIVRLIDDTRLRRQLASAGRKIACENFMWSRSARYLVELARRLSDGRRPGRAA